MVTCFLLYQKSLILTHRDRGGDAAGQRAGRHEKLAATSAHMQARDGRKKAARLVDGVWQGQG